MIDGLEVAATRRARGRGLLGREGIDGALWLPGVRSVHTAGMRFTIDVAWLGDDGRVLRLRTMRPWRVSGWVQGAAGVVEAEGGAFARWGLQVGSLVAVSGVDRINGDEPGPGCDGRRRA